MTNVRLDRTGLAAIAKSPEMKRLVAEAAQKIADNVNEQGIEVGAFKGGSGRIPLPVQVKAETTDRAAASVILAHPAGIAAQAKYGALTRAASAVGLTVQGD